MACSVHVGGANVHSLPPGTCPDCSHARFAAMTVLARPTHKKLTAALACLAERQAPLQARKQRQEQHTKPNPGKMISRCMPFHNAPPLARAICRCAVRCSTTPSSVSLGLTDYPQVDVMGSRYKSVNLRAKASSSSPKRDATIGS